MSASWATGALIGAGIAGGLTLIWFRSPLRRRPLLDSRLAPYLGVRSDDQVDRLLAAPTVTPLPTLERIVRPYLSRWAATLERVLGGAGSVRRRLTQAGRAQTLHEFRIEQLLWAAGTAGAAIAIGLVLLAAGYAGHPVMLLTFVAGAAAGGVIACDHRLTVAVRRRERHMMAEFPTIADLLALSVAAGDGPVHALERVARTGHGELARELRHALADARTGTSLTEALDRIAERTSLMPLARFVDGVAVAVERGTPLADVLRAQASDVREQHKRVLMDIGGRKEILMMVPVVFLVLPVTVIFALYPGLIQITAVVP